MKSFAQFLGIILCATVLGACGGGSSSGGTSGSGGTSSTGGGTTPPVTPGGEWLSLTPSAVSVITYEGEDLQFTVTGKASKKFAQNFNIGIIEPTGVITNQISINPISMMEYAVGLNTVAALTPGVHTTRLEVRLCEDNPAVCAKPFPGSPWYVPLNVTVKSKAEGAKRLTLTPAAQDLTAYEGEPAPFTINARMDTVGNFNVAVLDAAGIVSTVKEGYASNFGHTEYNATLQTSAQLIAGTYTTNLEVRVCKDDPKICKRPLAGSPWFAPLKVTAKSNTNLTALQTLPQVNGWSTYQGNAAHTGYVPATFDPGKFLRRWRLAYDNKDVTGRESLAVDNGVIFIVKNGGYNNSSGLLAISEDTGQALWRVNLGKLYQVNSPAAANGKVYVTSTGYGDTYLWVFDQKTGDLLGKTSMNSQAYQYLAPTIAGNDVYTQSGYYGGLSKFNALTNQLQWQMTNLPRCDSWTPAVDANYAYAYLQGSLYAVSVADGGIAFQVTDPGYPGYCDEGNTIVLSGTQMAYVVDDRRFIGFDLATRTRAWSQGGSVVGQPAYANNAVYILNASGSVLEARSADKGALLWTSNALLSLDNETWFDRVIVTDNLAFVSSDLNTLAIDLKTHRVVWAHPLGGAMAISNRGVLYIMSKSGKLHAVNLQ